MGEQVPTQVRRQCLVRDVTKSVNSPYLARSTPKSLQPNLKWAREPRCVNRSIRDESLLQRAAQGHDRGRFSAYSRPLRCSTHVMSPESDVLAEM